MESYHDFVLSLYMEIRSHCHTYGKLKKQIKNINKEFRWRQINGLGEMIEFLLQEEIDSVLDTLNLLNIPR